MADKHADQHRNTNQQDHEPDKSHRFINEKIVRQPLSRRQVARKILLTVFCAVLFGVLSAICFVVSRPVAERLLGQGPPRPLRQRNPPKRNRPRQSLWMRWYAPRWRSTGIPLTI